MNPPLPIAAGIGLDAIIWLVILVFWAIAQVLQKSKGRGAPGQPPRRTPSPIDDEIREMLEQLAGRPPSRETASTVEVEEEFEEIEQPPARPAPPPPPPRRNPQPVRVARRETAPPPVRPAYTPPARLDETYDLPELKTLRPSGEFAEEMKAAAALMSAGGMSMSVKGMNMRSTSLSSASSRSTGGIPPLSLAELRDSASLKKFILGKMVLDPPRSLIPYGAESRR